MTKAHITELLAFARPPTAVVQVFEGLVILLAPSTSFADWTQIRKWLAANRTHLLEMLLAFDKSKVTDEQLDRLKVILAKDECQPQTIKTCSVAAYGLCQWLRAVAYAGEVNKNLRQ